MTVSKRDKASLFTEFKSTMLDKHYQRIKIKMIETIVEQEHSVIYSCYLKKNKGFPQNFKEDTYIALLSRIILSIEANVSVIFDSFNKADFETRIIKRMSEYSNVQAIMARDSQLEGGLQFVDNMCSVIRMKMSDSDKHGFYPMIEKCVQRV